MNAGDNDTLLKTVWFLAASLSGAITAQIWQPYKDMSPGKVALTIFAGTSFGYFVFPVVFHSVTDQKVSGGLIYLMASGWNLLLPSAIKWIERAFGGGSTGGKS